MRLWWGEQSSHYAKVKPVHAETGRLICVGTVQILEKPLCFSSTNTPTSHYIFVDSVPNRFARV